MLERAAHRIRPLIRRHPQQVLRVVLRDEQLHVLQRVFDAEQTAPRLAEQIEVVLVQAKRLADLLNFLNTLNVPFGVVIGIILTPPLRTSLRPALSK
jgi:hypothetical protein